MSTRKTPLLDELARRNTNLVEAKTRPRAIAADHQAAKANAARISEELIEAFASDNQALITKLTRAKATAEAKAAEPWGERGNGATRAANRLEAERDTWTREHYAALITEVTPEAEAVANSITAHIDALGQAISLWSTVEQRVATIARSAGQNSEVMPRIDAFQQALRSFLREVPDVPTPLPRTLPSGTFTPTTSPDAEVRARAREALLNAGQG